MISAADFKTGKVFPLWEGAAPLAKGNEKEDTPTIQYFAPPPWFAMDKALVILPGGGYRALAQHEGIGFAEFFASKGIHSFVVNYRLGSHNYHHPAEVSDAARGIRLVRNAAKDLGFSPDKIGLVGSSAGGHLAAFTATWHKEGLKGADEIMEISGRPDFIILCYPVISALPEWKHHGSFQNLLGKEEFTTEDIQHFSMELAADAATPPAFIWHGGEDAGVKPENSILYALRLRSLGIKAELHIYEKGGHGCGLGNGHPWGEEALRYIRTK